MVAGTGTQYLDGLPVGIEQAHTTLHSNQPGPDGIWLRILQEVSAKNNQAIQGSLLILGNERTGKTALVSRLTGGERRLYSSVLEYSYLQIQADADASYAYQLGGGGASGLLGPTDSANLPVWILDGKEEVAPLLKFTFPPNLAKCVVILNASLEQPGNILPALRRWYRLLDEQIRQHYQPEEIVAARQAQVRFWQEYVEPTDSSLHQSSMTLTDATLNGGPGTGSSDHRPGSPLLLPPEKGILDENCGAALCVVVTKSDLYTELSTEQLDKVQYHVRQFCLRHGAALIYTSAKEDLNTQLLHKYIAHRIYALPFTTPAYIVEKDRIFVPTGWDSEQKLSIVKEALGFGNSEVPMLPQQMHNNPHADPMVSFARTAEREIEAEDEQAFLSRLASMTMDSSGGGGGGSSNGQQSPRRGGGGGGEGAGGGGGGGAKGTGDSNNTMLAFFSSLLTKDNQRPPSTHSPKSGGSPAPSVTSAMSVDAEQHFQKLAKRSVGGGPTPPQAQRSASNMSAGGARPKLGGGAVSGSPQPAQQQPTTTESMMDEADNNNANGDGDGEEEFEDAPEGDDESFGSSSMGSTTVTPRSGGGGGGATGVAGGGGTTTTGSSTEQGPPPDIQQQPPSDEQ